LRRVSAGDRLFWCPRCAKGWQWEGLRAGEGGSFKCLKKTSATLLRSQPRFADLRSYWLAHAPKSMSDRSYSAPDPALFAEAVAWLGQQYSLGNGLQSF
jgi:hypothetical protein